MTPSGWAGKRWLAVSRWGTANQLVVRRPKDRQTNHSWGASWQNSWQLPTRCQPTTANFHLAPTSNVRPVPNRVCNRRMAANSQHLRKPRGPGRPFLPGQSGNPNGRPAVAAEVRDLARQHGPHAIERLVALSRSNDEMVALHACRALLDRGYGKPMQEVAITPIPFGSDPLVITDPAEAANAYSRIVRGDLEPEAVRFLPTPQKAVQGPSPKAPGARR